jgi:hypothetical protein
MSAKCSLAEAKGKSSLHVRVKAFEASGRFSSQISDLLNMQKDMQRVRP